MKQEIKERIEKIRKGEVPEGYQETDIGIYPDNWSKAPFSDLFTFDGGYPSSWDELGDKGIAYLHYGLIHKSKKSYIDVDKELDALPKLQIDIENVPEKNIIPNGAVVFVDASEDYEGVSNALTIINDKNISFINGLHTIVGKRKNERLTIGYSKYFLKDWGIRKQIMFYAQGVKVLGINKHNLNKIMCFLPNEKEQNKIASIISKWDKIIELKERLIEEKTEFKKGFVENLLFGKSRFSNFINSKNYKPQKYYKVPEDWDFVQIKEIAKEVSQKNGNQTGIPVLSCTKYDGLVDSLKYFKKQIFSNDLSPYKKVKRNDFVYATNHIDEGSIGCQNIYDCALVSPMYTVFETNSRINVKYLFTLLKTNLYIFIYNVQMSASVDRRGSLRWNEFKKIKIPLPSLNEQNKIAECIEAIDTNLSLMKSELEALKEQKRGLMQLLLTGIIRVKVD